MVEIAKALSFEPKIMIFDEPTSSLTHNEVRKLFEVINRLKSEEFVLSIYLINLKRYLKYVIVLLF